ncbi:MAG: VCBS repeat-containing protein [Pirellulales bacterium]|nr:VCBS repeat-containing protein [Pirellulales bacterium]
MSDRQVRSIVVVSGWLFALGAAAFVCWALFGGTSGSRAGSVGRNPASRIPELDQAELPSAASPAAEESAVEASAAASKKEGISELPESERKYLWEVEHHVNLLADVGFPKVAAALMHADRERLAAILAEGFVAEVPGVESEIHIDSPVIHVARRQAEDGPLEKMDADAFLDYLMAFRARFPKEPRVKLSVKGFAPTVRYNYDSTWEGECLLRMWGESQPGQPEEVSMNLRYRLPRPKEELFEKGGWLTHCTVLKAQKASSTHFLMQDVAAERGIDTSLFHDNWILQEKGLRPQPVSGGAHLCDYNRDGWLDMLVNDMKGVVFYQGGPGGQLTDVTEDSGINAVLAGHLSLGAPLTTITTFADFDNDGWEDLLLGGLFLRNEEGRQFADVTHFSNFVPTTSATNVSVADFDRDGLVDIYICVPGQSKSDSWVEGKSGRSHGNLLYRNLGNWQFENVTERANAGGGFRSTFTAVWLDVNDDGWPDVHVPNEFGNGVLLVNRGDGTFSEHSLMPYPCDFGTMGLTCGDFDNDGRIDIYTANMYSKAGNRVIGNLLPDAYPPEVMAVMNTYTVGSQLYRNLGNLKFERLGVKYAVNDCGWAYGPCLADFDNDGFLDIFATCGFISRDRGKPDG